MALMLVDPMSTDPGSAEGRALGCICDPQPDAPVIGLYCPVCRWTTPALTADEWLIVSACPQCFTVADRLCERKRWDVEAMCPVHGLAAMKAWLDAERIGG